MPKLDQFSSAFKAATRRRLRYERPVVDSALIVTDLDEYEAHLLRDRVATFLAVLGDVAWTVATREETTTVGNVLECVERARPDLVVTYRNLHTEAWRWPYTLGDHLDVLTQVIDAPVLVLPRPDDAIFTERELNTNAVMAITDHLTGSDRLVNYAARFTSADGTLMLTHVEDTRTFERYMDIIGKIQQLDTETARERILERLLKEPQDYVDSCAVELAAAGLQMQVKALIGLGHHLAEYRRLVDEHEIDLLVMNAKDNEQLAMHGLAYPLAIELRRMPLLML